MLAQAQSPLIAPALLFVLALVAAIGIILLLPGRREASLRKIGGVIAIAAGIVFAALLAQNAAGMGAFFWIFSAIAIIGAVRVITHPKPVYSALYFVLTVMASAGLFVLMWAEFMAAALVLIYAGAILVTYVFVIMLAAQAAPAGTMHEVMAEHDAISREPVIASATGFALLGLLIFVIFDRSQEIPNSAAIQFATDTTGLLKPLLDTQDTSAEVFTVPTTRPSVGPDAAMVASSPIDRKTFTSSKNLTYTLTNPLTTQPSRFQPVGGTQKLGAYLFDKHLVNLELAGLLLTVAMVGAIVIARKRVIGGQPATAAETGVISVQDNPHDIPVVGTENPRQKEYPET